jgi:hypothetical protein
VGRKRPVSSFKAQWPGVTATEQHAIELLIKHFGSVIVEPAGGFVYGNGVPQATWPYCPHCETLFTDALWPKCGWCGFTDRGPNGDY